MRLRTAPERSRLLGIFLITAAAVGVVFLITMSTWTPPQAGRPVAEKHAMPEVTAPVASECQLPGGEVVVYESMPVSPTLLDGFEAGNLWSVESADDHAHLSLSPEHVSEGRQSLRVDFEAFGRDKFQIRRDGQFDLRGARALLLDIFLDCGPMEVALGLLTGPEGTFYGSRKVALQPGWNRAVAFPLTTPHFGPGSGGAHAVPVDFRLGDVRRLMLTFFEAEDPQGTVYLDNLRFERPRRAWVAAEKPGLRRVVATAGTIPLYGRMELTVEFDADFQHFFDRTDVDLRATFVSPRGRTRVVHGFVHNGGASGSAPIWKVRFTPDEVGRWLYDVTVENRYGEAISPRLSFDCAGRVPGSRAKGFVRVSRRDPRYFEHSNGDFFYPIGMNVAWAANMDYYFQRLAAQGGNLVRVWLCPWHLPLEPKTAVGSYDLLVAQQLDRLLDLAEAYGLYIQLVLQHHGVLSNSWADNPYNAVNGGPCRQPEEFFTDVEARHLFRRFLGYLTARWAHSPALFAWELWNEVDLARYRSAKDVVEWHREMSEFLRQADPYGHLVTTSISRHDRESWLRDLPGLDFLAPHLYSTNLPDDIGAAYQDYAADQPRPYFLGEFAGRVGQPPPEDDPRGIRLAAGLWLSFCTPAAGAGLPWWWDVYIDRNQLYGHFGALARFAAGHDRRGRNFRSVAAEIVVGDLQHADLRGIVSPSAGYFYIFDRNRVLKPAAPRRAVLPRPAQFTVRGLLGGNFVVEVWDVRIGRRLRSEEVGAVQGEVKVSLPASEDELAVKVEHLGPVEPGVVP